jgi:hypothetical protein
MNKRLAILAYALLSSFVCRADVQATSKRLAGNGALNWIVERVEMVMGPAGGCKRGEVWRFGADHSVEIRQCAGGKLVTRKDTWSLDEVNDLDTVLTVGSAKYYITFYNKADGKYMQLKSVSESKAEERLNKEFRLNDQ